MQHVNSIPPPSGVAEAESCVERLGECLQATAEASFAEVGAAPVSRWVLSRAGSEHSRRFVSSSCPFLAAAATLTHVMCRKFNKQEHFQAMMKIGQQDCRSQYKACSE